MLLSQLVSCHAAHDSISGAVSCGIWEGVLVENLFCLHTRGGLPWCSQAPKCVCVYDLYCMFSVHHDVTGHLEHHKRIFSRGRPRQNHRDTGTYPLTMYRYKTGNKYRHCYFIKSKLISHLLIVRVKSLTVL